MKEFGTEIKMGRPGLVHIRGGGGGEWAVLCLLSGRVGKTQSRVEREKKPRFPVLLLKCTGILGRRGIKRSGKQENSKKIHLCRHWKS